MVMLGGDDSKEDIVRPTFSSTAGAGEANLACAGVPASLARTLSACHAPDSKYPAPGVTKDLHRSQSLPALVGGVRTPG